MGVNESNAGQPSGRRPGTLPVGQQNLLCISDDYLLNVTPAVDQDSDLPSDFPGNLREIACQFRGTYLGKGNPPPIDVLDSFVLTRFQPECVAEDLLYGSPPNNAFITY